VPLSGVLAAVLILVGGSLASGGPDVDAAASDISEWYVDTDTAILAGTYLVWLGALLVLPFAAFLGRGLRVGPDRGDWLPTTLVSGGVALAALLLVGGIFNWVAASRPYWDESLDPQVAKSLYTIAWDFSILPTLAFAVLLGSAAVAGLRSRMLPGWMSWTAAVLAVASLVSWVVWIAFWLDLLWMGATGVFLVLRPRPVEPTST
jgi:hypothetical protein